MSKQEIQKKARFLMNRATSEFEGIQAVTLFLENLGLKPHVIDNICKKTLNLRVRAF